MTQSSRLWDGTATGDATSAPYSLNTAVAEVLAALAGGMYTVNKGGVFHGIEGSLRVTGATSPLSISPGQSLVYGGWFHNDAAISQAVATPGATRNDLLVCRRSWSTQQTRLTVITGIADGSGTVPSVTQVENTTWDIPIFSWSITSGGAITLTDLREFIPNAAVRIARQVVTTAGATITITMPNANLDYTNIRLKVQGRVTGAVVQGKIQITFNGDSGSNYDGERLNGTNASAAAVNQAATAFINAGALPGASVTRAGIAGYSEIVIPNFNGTTFEKDISYNSGFSDSTAANSIVEVGSGSWRNTAAITSITLTASSTNFAVGTVVEVWAE